MKKDKPPKDKQIIIRVDSKEKEGFERAAEISGIGLSTWARQALRGAAIKQIQEAGETIIFLEPIPINTVENGNKH